MLGTRTLAGHSLPFNLLFVLLNVVGLTLTTLAFHPHFEGTKWVLAVSGILVLFLSILGIIFFKGKLLLATIARVFVGNILLVSGIIKLNDPVGFGYKLEEYFQDGALAYRVKELIGSPGFSLESWVNHAFSIGIVLCVLEIVIGVLLIIGGKIKWTSTFLVLLMLFFTLLTWHTANCDSSKRFIDRDEYTLNSTVANRKIEQSKNNKDIRIIDKTANNIVVEELKTPQCVTDCGCFGDALKGSVGRSLLPSESFWKDLILLYFAIWIFVAQRRLEPNSVKDNWIIIPTSLALLLGFSIVFNWFFLQLFASILLIGALWMYRSGGKFLENHIGSALFVVVICTGFVWYVRKNDPLKDYRPYAVGTNLKQSIKSGSIDTITFNPSVSSKFIATAFKIEKWIAQQVERMPIKMIRLNELRSNTQKEILLEEYNIESYPVENFTINDTIERFSNDNVIVSGRSFLINQKNAIVVAVKDVELMSADERVLLKQFIRKSRKKNIPLVIISGSSEEELAHFVTQNKFGDVLFFVNDTTEMKIIARSNVSYLVLKKGTIVGKYTPSSLPSFQRIEEQIQ